MKKVTKTKQVTETLYEATDGTIHYSEGECKYHEWKASKEPVWIVYSRGQRTESTEVYSTEEKAIKSLGDSTSHYIKEIYLDSRFWEEEWQEMQDA